MHLAYYSPYSNVDTNNATIIFNATLSHHSYPSPKINESASSQLSLPHEVDLCNSFFAYPHGLGWWNLKTLHKLLHSVAVMLARQFGCIDYALMFVVIHCQDSKQILALVAFSESTQQ